MQFSVEMIGYVAAFCTTSSFLPQAILTIRSKDTESLSLGMYGMFTAGVLFWLIYVVIKQDNALIWANIITLGLAAIILSYKIRSLFQNRKQS